MPGLLTLEVEQISLCAVLLFVILPLECQHFLDIFFCATSFLSSIDTNLEMIFFRFKF